MGLGCCRYSKSQLLDRDFPVESKRSILLSPEGRLSKYDGPKRVETEFEKPAE
jgi:hypothetical protein